jgi:hypothetical protein
VWNKNTMRVRCLYITIKMCLSFCPFSFSHCVFCASSIYRFTPLVSSNSSQQENRAHILWTDVIIFVFTPMRQGLCKHFSNTKEWQTHPPYEYSYKSCDKSWMRKRPGSIWASGTYPWSFVTKIFHNGQPSYGGDHITFEVMTSTWPQILPGRFLIHDLSQDL